MTLRERTRQQVGEVVLDVPPGRVTTYGTIASVLGIGARQVGLIMATADPSWPWWRVTNARGELPVDLRERAGDEYAREGTPMRGERVDMALARWTPPW